ncbi:MAG: pre-toxin TG domain-containing protein [Zetaproteobacteria bacterium]|nr:pre-toxin TG domain-containing protein [Zetaproteobacteria bacterium]
MPKVVKIPIILTLFLSFIVPDILQAQHSLERDCCRRKAKEAARARSISRDLGNGVPLTGVMAAEAANILGSTVALPIGWAVMFGAVGVARALDLHASRLDKKYERCLENHIREHEQQMAAERERLRELEEARKRQEQEIEDERAHMQQAKSWMTHAQGQMNEIQKQLGWATFHRKEAMDEYRALWNRKMYLEAKFQEVERLYEEIDENDFFYRPADTSSMAAGDLMPFSFSVEMELHAPDAYASESDWLYVYHQSSNKVLWKVDSPSREILERAQKRDEELQASAEVARKRAKDLQCQIDEGQDLLGTYFDQASEYLRARRHCDFIWPRLAESKQQIDADTEHFRHASQKLREELDRLERNHQEYEEALKKIRKNYTMRSKIQRAEVQIERMNEHEQRTRILDQARNAAAQLPFFVDPSDSQDSEAFEVMYEAAETLVDLALSVTPGISVGRDLYEATSGRHILTGEPLSTLDRSIAIVGLLTFGIGSKIGKLCRLDPNLDLLDNFFHGEEALKAFQKGEEVFEAGKLNKWDIKGLLHVFKGEYRPGFKLFSGMHTNKSLDHLIAMNSKVGPPLEVRSISKLSEFSLDTNNTKVLKQTLSNGVTRVQLPQAAFDGNRWKKAFTEKIPQLGDKRLKSVKTLWPDSYTPEKVMAVAQEIKSQGSKYQDAMLKAVSEGKNGFQIFGRSSENIRVTLAFERKKESGEYFLKTAYPAWIQ